MTREELRRLCDGEFSQRLQALEAERAAARRSWTLFGLSALLAVPAGFVISRMELSLGPGAFAFLVVAIPPLYVFSRQAHGARSRRQAAFQELMGAVAARVLPGASYRQQGSASIRGTVDASGIFNQRAQECETLAAVSGATHPSGLVFGEIRLYRVGYDFQRGGDTSAAEDQRSETDVFRGLFFAFDLGTAIRGTTFVDPKRAGASIAARDALEPVSLEDPNFERLYRVTASDPVEARALLLPSAMAGLLRLHEKAKQPVHLSISDNRVSVAIEFGRPLFGLGPRPVDFERVAAVADLFALPDVAAAAMPVGLPLRGPAAGARASALSDSRDVPGDAPARPATSKTRLKRDAGGVSVVYTRAVSRLALALSALGAPVVGWFWFLAVRELLDATGDKTGVFAAMIPLSVASFGWLFAAQAWWNPVRRVDVGAGELRVSRGFLRRNRVPAASVRGLAIRKGVLYANQLAISPSLPGAELRWLAYELSREIPSQGGA